MIKSISSILDTDEILVIDMGGSGETLGFLISGITGISGPKTNINLLEGSNYDGGVANSARVQQRSITINMIVIANGEKEEDARSLIYKFFPSKRKITLRIETSIDTHTGRMYNIEAYVEQVEFSHFSMYETVTITLLCPYPYFSSFQSTVLRLLEFSSSFTFPFSNESLTQRLLNFGDSYNVLSANVGYDGHTETGFVTTWNVRYYTVGFPTDYGVAGIINASTLVSMEIDVNRVQELAPGGALQLDDLIILDTRKGKKSLKLKRGATVINVITALDYSKGWLTLVPGANELISLTRDVSPLFPLDPNKAYNIEISYDILYEGV